MGFGGWLRSVHPLFEKISYRNSDIRRLRRQFRQSADKLDGGHLEFTVCGHCLFEHIYCCSQFIFSSGLLYLDLSLGVYYASRICTLACRPDGLACTLTSATCVRACNIYSPMVRMSLQSALIGFLVSKFFPTPITPQENVVLQTTAVATGTVRMSPEHSIYAILIA